MMKTQSHTLTGRSFLLLFCMISLGLLGCKEDTDFENPFIGEIDTELSNLSYDANNLLNVQNTGGLPNVRDSKKIRESSEPIRGNLVQCTTVQYNLKNNFSEISILQPTNGIVYPGALVVANQELLDGVPMPIRLDRAPMTLRLDLPGMGENGTVKIDDVSNSSVQSGIDNALQWWNENASPEGYANATYASYNSSAYYSSSQLALDVGMSLQWAGRGDVSAQFSFNTSTKERSAMMVFKQIYYTVTMDEPSSPGAVFGKDVTPEQIQQAISSETPPAYISTVFYGRILMFRMTTTEKSTDAELQGAFNYASGRKNASGDLRVKYENILQKSTIQVTAIGGNAATTTEAIVAASSGNFNLFKSVISGENAVFSERNPGVPIAYKALFLKDGALVKLGYATDYKIETCKSSEFVHKSINYRNRHRGTARITLSQVSPGGSTIRSTVEVKSEHRFTPLRGYHSIKLKVEHKEPFKSWKFVDEKDLGHIEKELCFQSIFSNARNKLVSNNCSN